MARQLGTLFADTGRFYQRDGLLTEVRQNAAGFRLEIIKPALFVSLVEDVARVVKKTKHDQAQALLPNDMASNILQSRTFKQELPEIKGLSNCPILSEREGRLESVAGYDPTTGILAHGKPVPMISPADAKVLLDDLLQDYVFATESDRSRALAAFLTPALLASGLLQSATPAVVLEADDSQTGKGYLVRLVAAVYASVPATVVQTKGGGGRT